ncbi:MAG: hypothetical protein J6C46_02825 [Clostridia bacterium]|nr:hypothetical protein [Clostridia bacterium]
MDKSLSLELNKDKEITFVEQSQNILNNISQAFSNAVKKGTELIEFPDNIGASIKDGIEKMDLKEIGASAVESALKSGMKSLGMKSSTFNSLKNIFDAVIEGDLKKGLASGLNVVIGALKIPNTAKTLLKNGKNLILDEVFEDELKKVMEKQKNTISRIDKKCNQMEEAFKQNDLKTLDRIAKTLKTDLEKVMPVQNVIARGNFVLNRYQLFKSKGMVELTQMERELCEKLA